MELEAVKFYQPVDFAGVNETSLHIRRKTEARFKGLEMVFEQGLIKITADKFKSAHYVGLANVVYMKAKPLEEARARKVTPTAKPKARSKKNG